MSDTQLVKAEDEEFRVNPESLEIAQEYLQTSSVDQTAKNLQLDRELVAYHLNKKEVKRFIDTVFLDQGYMNRHKLQATLTNIIDQKLEEMEESEMASTADISVLLKMAHDMRMAELRLQIEREKALGPKVQINQNTQNNYGENYSDLLSKLLTDNGNK